MPGRIWIYALLISMCAINYVDRVALSVAAGPIKSEFGLTTIEMGYLFSAFVWTYIASLIPWGIAVDRKGPRWIAVICMAIWSLATVATGFANSFTTIFLARLVMGVGEASTFPVGGRAIREWVPTSERGLVNVLFNSSAFAGSTIGTLLVGAVTSVAGWRSGFVAAGSIGFVWIVFWLAFYRRPEEFRLIASDERDRIVGGRVDSAIVTGPNAGLRDLLRCRTIWALALTQGCIIYGQYMFLTWMPSYLQTERHLSILSSGVYTALPYVVALVVAVSVGLYSDRWLAGHVESGRRRAMVVGAMLVSAVVLALPWVTSTLVIVLLFTISLSAGASAAGLNLALLNDMLADPSNTGRAYGFVVMGGNVFGVAAPIATGYVVAYTGSYDCAFIFAGCLLLAGAAICFVLTRRMIAPASTNYSLAT